MTGLRIGVVGLGRVGVMHARNIAQADGVSDVILIGRDTTKTEHAADLIRSSILDGAPVELAGEFAPTGNIPARIQTTTARFGAALSGLDGIVVATSTETHPQLAIEAAEAGIPALVEKPLALDLATLEATCRRLEATGSPVMIAFHRRYDPAHRALRQRIADGEAGTVRIISATDHDRLPLDVDYIPRSGGIWRDLLIHDFDIIPWVTGQRIVSVTAHGSVLDAAAHAEHGDVDTAAALLTLESGAIATVTATRRNGAGQDVRLEVFGSDGTFGAGISDRTPVTSTEPGGNAPTEPYQQFIDRFELAFRAETDAFLRLAAGTGENGSPPRAGVDALRVALAAARSLETGATVTINGEALEAVS
ncbi:myo-inositol 2-dehydrogenase/D-chiro-inositol 1-dehydrogenase [Microcella alkaliphila]|uniref:Myo-inositol 2-dehydrogenase/D-chiro-inositol 1-dehydrogenase n=1 Tax=Microcella alkaliphila TaxID=279828 RepID=A0A4Q7TZ83_9MICO|nr:Gfo/Idh/MocA family oxidoreductase [Microcella alkaliphila]RZT66476.1 myo-inositol 2-dehydrogenase/D-chiro-inositol 1-dehydrogenase [Microcella alkaliphila]